jgi:hypothetical protein
MDETNVRLCLLWWNLPGCVLAIIIKKKHGVYKDGRIGVKVVDGHIQISITPVHACYVSAPCSSPSTSSIGTSSTRGSASAMI